MPYDWVQYVLNGLLFGNSYWASHRCVAVQCGAVRVKVHLMLSIKLTQSKIENETNNEGSLLSQFYRFCFVCVSKIFIWASWLMYAPSSYCDRYPFIANSNRFSIRSNDNVKLPSAFMQNIASFNS